MDHMKNKRKSNWVSKTIILIVCACVGYFSPSILKSFGVNLAPNQSIISDTDLENFTYYPVFPADSEDAPFQGKRRSSAEMAQEVVTMQESQPVRKIYRTIGNERIIVIPMTKTGSHVHFNFLDNFSESEGGKSEHCHLSELLFADAQGNLLDNKQYKFFAAESVKNSYPGEGVEKIIDGDRKSVWHSADGANAPKHPYTFGLDLGEEIKSGYLIFVYRNGRGEYARPRNMKYLLNQSEETTGEYISLNTEDYVVDRGRLKRYDYVTADAAGVISLPHYRSSPSNKGMQHWQFWSSREGNYTVVKRSFHGKIGQEKITLSEGINSFSTDENIKLVHLIPEKLVQPIVASPGALKPNFTEPDLSKIHPEIVRKMEKVTGGKYDIRTTVPEKMKAGKNGYLIITTRKKKESLTMLDAFIMHKESKGFEVSVITEKDYGGGIGVEAALNIRKWLQQNYAKKNALYVLMLGNPDPRKGDVPYKKVGMKKEETKGINELGMKAYRKANPKFDNHDGIWPTDYFYVDLTGDWDKNKNGIYADNGDYEAGGIDGQPEVYVGRIPFYGVNAPVGDASDVDTILARVIRYENQGDDLSWRHNIYYAGDTFQRTQTFYNDFLAHNGAKLIRHTHSPNMLFSPDIDHYKENETVQAQNADKYGFVYYQEHGSPWSIGMMSTGGTEQLKDDYPPVFALGGCDVASPEFPENVSYALLRNAGIGVYAGTRSVWSCSSNSWAKHTFYYPRLCFGMSTGEVLWTTRADQSRDRTIGGTNFLINLLGDPSIVPMPKTTGPELSISPGFEVKLAMIQGDMALPDVEFEVQNNSGKPQTVRLKSDKGLNLSATDMKLAAGEFKQFKVSVRNPEQYPTGEHRFKLVFSMGEITEERAVTILVHPKKRLFYNDFDSPISYIGADKKPILGDPAKTLVDGKFSKAAHVAKERSILKTGKLGNREGFSISFYQYLNDEGNYDIIRSKAISVLTRKGKVGVWLSPTGWSYGPSISAKIYDGPDRKLKSWQHVTVIFNRAERTLTISVDGISKTHPLSFSDSVNFSIDQMELFATGRAGFSIDELAIYNYPLTKNEMRLLELGQLANPLFPLDNSTIGKARIEWQSKTPVQLEIATDITFQNIIYRKEIGQTSAEHIPEVAKEGSYYWRVNSKIYKAYLPSNIIRSFTIKHGVEPIAFKLKSRGLPTAKIGVSGYNVRIDRFITDCDRSLIKDFIFKKTAGPEWLKIYPDGLLFTNYGATEADKGINKFEYQVTSSDGTSKKSSFEILVE